MFEIEKRASEAEHLFVFGLPHTFELKETLSKLILNVDLTPEDDKILVDFAQAIAQKSTMAYHNAPTWKGLELVMKQLLTAAVAAQENVDEESDWRRQQERRPEGIRY